MPTVTINIDGQQVVAEQNSTLLATLKANNITVHQICGGQGMCSTCHLFVISGADALAPQTQQEQKTFQFTKIDRAGARLACQTRVISSGAVVELPKGTFVESEQDLAQEIGKKAKQTLIHPMTGEILVEEGKLVMRSAVEKMKQSSSSFAANIVKN
jgi:ferredoxin